MGDKPKVQGEGDYKSARAYDAEATKHAKDKAAVHKEAEAAPAAKRRTWRPPSVKGGRTPSTDGGRGPGGGLPVGRPGIGAPPMRFQLAGVRA